jgi:hypothetical protein
MIMSIANTVRSRIATRKPTPGGGGYFPLDGEGSISDYPLEVIGFEVKEVTEFTLDDHPGVPCEQIRFKVRPVEQHPDAVDWPDPDDAPEFMTSSYKAWGAGLYGFDDVAELGDSSRLTNETRQSIVARNEEAYIRYFNVLAGREADSVAGEDFAEIEESIKERLLAGETFIVNAYVRQTKSKKANDKYDPRDVKFDSLISG